MRSGIDEEYSDITKQAEGGIPMALRELNNIIDLIAKQVETLTTKLIPISVVTPTSDTGPPEHNNGARSPIADEVNASIDRLRAIETHLQYIKTSLDL